MSKNRIKVLILCPPFSDRGGVAYYYTLVRDHFQSEYVSLDYYHTGKNYQEKPDSTRIFKSLNDLVNLIKIISNFDLIVLNPSLDNKAVIRDGLLHFLSKKIFKKNTLIFFHGWNSKTELLIDKHFKHLIKILFQSDCLCVLANQFRRSLISWGIQPERIKLETTIFKSKKSSVEKSPYNIIFLSRFVNGKGCFTALKAIGHLIGSYPNIILYMVGDGHLLPKLKAYVKNHNLTSNVVFTGYLKGEQKYNLLEKCGIMLYPTSYGEGLPISILEGMGMGCVIISRPIGGICDLLNNGRNGILVSSLEPLAYAKEIDHLYKNPEIREKIANESSREAMEKFEVEIVVKRLEQLYLEAVIQK